MEQPNNFSLSHLMRLIENAQKSHRNGNSSALVSLHSTLFAGLLHLMNGSNLNVFYPNENFTYNSYGYDYFPHDGFWNKSCLNESDLNDCHPNDYYRNFFENHSFWSLGHLSHYNFYGDRYYSDFFEDMAWTTLPVVYAIVTGLLGVIGIMSNLINMSVLLRMGALSETINLSFLYLSLINFWSTLNLLWVGLSICLDELVSETFYSLYIVTAEQPRLVLGQMTCWATAFTAFQNCLCVLLPIKAKKLFSLKRCALAYFITTVVILLINVPIHGGVYLMWDDSEWGERFLNMTYFMSEESYTWAVGVNNFGLRIVSIQIVLVGNLIAYAKFTSRKTWRNNMATLYSFNPKTSEEQPSVPTSSHEIIRQRVGDDVHTMMSTQTEKQTAENEEIPTRLVMRISAMFFFCFVPSTILEAVALLAYLPGGLTTEVLLGLSFVIEGINSSFNILLFYFGSSQFKDTLRKMMRRGNY